MNLHQFSDSIGEFILGIIGWLLDVVGLDRLAAWVVSAAPRFWLATLFDIVIALVIAILNVLIMLWIERKLMGRLMDRRATMLIPPFMMKVWGKRYPSKFVISTGFFQNLADGTKFFVKEHIIPLKADKFGFAVAPIIIVSSSLLLLVSLPLSDEFYVVNLNAGLLFVFAIFAIAPFAILVAGWAQNNKYTLIGGMRSAAQMMSYEIPLLLSLVGVIIVVGSFNIGDIVAYQQNNNLVSFIPHWFVITQFIGFLVFMIAIVAEVERIPFDLPEAEAELVEGWTTEYGGARWVLMMLAAYIRGFAGCAMATYLFLGGWAGPTQLTIGGMTLPFIPPEIWFLIKVYILFIILVWIRASLPRIRTDQILEIGWKRLLPLSILNIFIALIFVEYGWAMAIGALVVMVGGLIVHMLLKGRGVVSYD